MTRTTPEALLAALSIVALLGAPSLALAQSEDTAAEDEATAKSEARDESLADRIQSVERKVFLKRRRFEVHPYVGMDLNDAFFQHFFVGAGVAYHLEDSFAVELRGGAAVGEVQKGSVRFVRLATGSLLEGQPSLLAHADVDATWAPIYGKLSLFGESILHFDTFVTAGVGIFATQRGERATPEAELLEVTNVNPAVNLGIGQRYYINEWLVFRFDIRNYSFIETGAQSDFQNVTVLGLAISGFFPMSFAYEYQ